MYPHDLPAFVAMSLGTRYAAEASERLSIYAGRTCGIAAKISRPLLTGRALGANRLRGGPDALRAVLVEMLPGEGSRQGDHLSHSIEANYGD
jgi:hypothetical protein